MTYSISGARPDRLPLLIGESRRAIYAGPYRAKPAGMYGIKLAGELPLPADFDLPIRDFGVPKDARRLAYGLAITLDRLARYLPTYVGCFGGRGRTGLFLALLAKATGVRDPVEYVRRFYNPHAVETDEQYDYVERLDLRPLKFALWKAKGTAALVDFARQTGTDSLAGATLTESVNLV